MKPRRLIVWLFIALAAFGGRTVSGQESRSRDDRASRPSGAESRPGEDAEGDEAARAAKKKRDEQPKRGIPVTERLLFAHCTACHATEERDGQKYLSRISYLRKSPEGWELSVKRMIRQHNLSMTPDDAREIVAYLSNDHGLTRAEAERGLAESERRVHWSDASADKEFRETCGACHSLGRVYGEQRDLDEWKLLKLTHLAFFPLADFQAFRGNQRMGGDDGVNFDRMSESEIEEYFERRREQQRSMPDRADKVMEKLAKDQPLFSKGWEDWTVSRREVPLQGTWSVVGHEVTRGDIRGSVTIRRTDKDTYETTWTLTYGDGATVRREGKAYLYAGYSWRGRSKRPDGAPREPETLKEVLLLNDDWNVLKGRCFTGGYDELGADVTLRRETGATALLTIEEGVVTAPAKGAKVDVVGQMFPADVAASDFHLGTGITVTAAERIGQDRVRLTVDVLANAELGRRAISFRAVPGPKVLTVYDTIDYIKVTPEQGFSRIGGAGHPKQLERFEAVAMCRGKDQKPYTDDDFAVKVVPARWRIEEFAVRENDDDAQFVGEIDSKTGVFTPALEGPNPKRKYKANNIGDVYVVAEATIVTPEAYKPPESRPSTDTASTSRPESRSESRASTRPATRPAIAYDPKLLTKEMKARGRLLVTVPLYVKWDRYVWDQR